MWSLYNDYNIQFDILYLELLNFAFDTWDDNFLFTITT